VKNVIGNYIGRKASGQSGPKITLGPADVALDLREIPSFNYTDPLILVFRTSDAQVEHFYQGASEGELNTVRGGGGQSLLSWVGSADGNITAWYDQSGNNRHFIQGNILFQPKIVIAGALVTENGKPAITFNPVFSQRLEGPNIDFTDNSIIAVYTRSTTDPSYQVNSIFGKYLATNFIWDAFLFTTYEPTASDRVTRYGQSNASNFPSAAVNFNSSGTQTLAFASKNNSAINVSANNNNGTPATPLSPYTCNEGTSIGNLKANNQWTFYPHSGTVQSIIFYCRDRSLESASLLAEVNNYYEVL
jgi:hypothetical protein